MALRSSPFSSPMLSLVPDESMNALDPIEEALVEEFEESTSGSAPGSGSEQREPMTEDEIARAAAAKLRTNRLYLDDSLNQSRELAYRYYKGTLPAPTDANDSTIVATDVADAIEWVLPAILKPLVESPDVVRFDPVTPEDQPQADLESDYVHHTFMKKCDGFTKLYCHIKDALLLKTGVFCTYWDEEVKHQKEEYRELTEVELADLLAPADNTTVKIQSSETREVPIIDVMTGEPLPGQPGQPAQPPSPENPEGVPEQPEQPPPTETVYDVVVRRYWSKGKPVVEVCEPEAFLVDMTHNSIDLTDARWCCYSMVKTRAELQAMGYTEDRLENMQTSDYARWNNQVRWEREDVERDSETYRGDNETGDPSQDLMDIHRVYMQLDADGDGFEEMYLIILGGAHGEQLLEYYEVPENPFSASTPFIAAHKFYGYSLFDKLKQLTDHKTKVLRMLEDNLDLTNNPRKKVLRGRCNLDDVLRTQVGGIWRMDQLDAVQEVPTPMISQQAQQLLDYYDKLRAERVGVDPNAQSISKIMPEESMNHAMERVLSMKEELVGLMIRVFAETGVKSMFLKLRGLMMRYNPREELVQLRNKWTTVNPGNWVERASTTIVVGLGTGDRIKKMQGLNNVLQLQMQIAEGGMQGILVSPERIGHTVSELIRVQGLGDPDDFVLTPDLLVDPRNHETPRGREMQRAQQLQQEQQQQAQQQEQQKMQAQQEQQQQLLDLQREVAQIQAQAKVQSAEIQAQSDSRKIMSDMQQFMEEMRLKWAELAAEKEADTAKAAADIGSKLILEGARQDSAERQSQAKNEGSRE